VSTATVRGKERRVRSVGMQTVRHRPENRSGLNCSPVATFVGGDHSEDHGGPLRIPGDTIFGITKFVYDNRQTKRITLLDIAFYVLHRTVRISAAVNRCAA
jgi:hypothetical protein